MKQDETGGRGHGESRIGRETEAVAKSMRSPAVRLLLALLLLFFTTPFIENLPSGDLIDAGLFTVVLLAAVPAVGGGRRSTLVAFALVLPAIAGKAVHFLMPNMISRGVFLMPEIFFVGYVIVHLIRSILFAPRVTADVLCSAVSGYFLIGFLWAVVFLIVGDMDSGAFAFNVGTGANRVMTNFNAFYFSFVTITTVGYGGIVPVSSFARTLAVLEAIVGMFYMTMLVARLVSIHSSMAIRSDR
jgi:hypothetical protein